MHAAHAFWPRPRCHSHVVTKLRNWLSSWQPNLKRRFQQRVAETLALANTCHKFWGSTVGVGVADCGWCLQHVAGNFLRWDEWAVGQRWMRRDAWFGCALNSQAHLGCIKRVNENVCAFWWLWGESWQWRYALFDMFWNKLLLKMHKYWKNNVHKQRKIIIFLIRIQYTFLFLPNFL